MSALVLVLILAQEWQVPPRPPMRRPDVAMLTTAPPILPDVQPGPVISVQPVPGSVSVSLSPVSKSATERILSKRAAKVAMPWLVSLRNDSQDAVSIQESAILSRIPQLQPFDHASLSLLISEAKQNSAWARAGRAGEDVTKLAAFLAASQQVRWGNTVLVVLTAVPALSPYIISRFRGAERPLQESFDRLAWIQPIQLQPGESATARIFTAVWPDPRPLTFSIDTSRLSLRKNLQ